MIRIQKAVNTNDFKIIAALASEIWTEHYTSIIGSKQVEYMLEKFQSEEAIRDQVQDDVFYNILYFNDQPAGYLSFFKKDDSLFLSKLYVLSQLRGNKIGKAGLDFIKDQLKELECDRIQLTVNKNNIQSIEAYKKMGFQIIDSIIIDIGNGFVMDDYLMEK